MDTPELPYEAAQCPICFQWVPMEGEPARFADHTDSDGKTCPESQHPIFDAPIEIIDRQML